MRGHSNVQGNPAVGIEEQPSEDFLDRLQQVFGFEPPRRHAYDAVRTIEAMIAGEVKVFVGLGGNVASATPDTPRTCQGLCTCALTVHMATKRNRSHLVHGREALLPVLGCTEVDVQDGVAQGVTVEDLMSMVHVSYGVPPGQP